jgi:hypothetical protein
MMSMRRVLLPILAILVTLLPADVGADEVRAARSAIPVLANRRFHGVFAGAEQGEHGTRAG